MIYDIAGKRVLIQNHDAFTASLCQLYLSVNQIDAFDFQVEVTPEELSAETSFTPHLPVGYIESIVLYRKICTQMAKYNRFLFHSAAVVKDGNAYLFAGPSGSGKSTHASLWEKYIPGATILNGDKPILAIEGNQLVAYGTPWCGKENRGYPGKAPVKAFCFVQQGLQNCCRKIDSEVISTQLLRQLFIPSGREGVEEALAFADWLTRYPFFELQCNISEEAVAASFEAITGGVYRRNA